MKNTIKITATEPNAKEMGIPENITNKVTAANNNPNIVIDILTPLRLD
jgi:hypothetical protein